MIERYAAWGVAAFAVWLVLIAGLMAFAPQTARAILRKAGTTHPINFGELSLRAAFGLSLIGLSAATRFPLAFFWAGAFMAGSSLVIVLMPLKWHSAYAVFWANRLPVRIVRLLAPVTLAGAAVAVWAGFPGLPALD